MSKKMIGVLVIDIEGAYSKMIWQEVARHTHARGYDLMVLPANNPGNPYNYRSQFNALYNFINPSVISALIIVPSILGVFKQTAAAAELLGKIQKAVPLVSLNTLIPGVPSLVIDNTRGIEEAVRHLVNDHGYRRIGFLEGPRCNNEAMERKSAFSKALEKVGFPLTSTCFFSGDFTEEAAARLGCARGQEIIDTLDAVVAANDSMAVGLERSLRQQGFSIPDDLAIVGFDDIQEAPFLEIPLSTIRQPFLTLAHRAAALAIDLCEGRPVSTVQRFGTELVVRASCGCRDYIIDDLLRPSSVEVTDDVGDSLRRFLDDHFAAQICGRLFPPIRDLIEFLHREDADDANKRRFLTRLAGVLEEEFFKFDSQPDWSLIFSFIIDCTRARAPSKMEAWQRLNLFDRGRHLISRQLKHWNGYKDLQRYMSHTLPLRQTVENMSFVQDRQEILTILEHALPRLGIRSCFISLLKDGEHRRGLYSSLPETSQLIMAYHEGRSDHLVSTERPEMFSTLDLWPPDRAPEPAGNVWAVGPLFNRERLYGFIISEIVDLESRTHESLRHQISLTLHSCYLSSEREKAESRLRDILGELEQNNQQLKKESLLDEMTGLLNRRGFFSRVEELLRRRRDPAARFALFFADMDGLKRINDSMGHAEGDRAITDMSLVFKQVFRREDVIARFGGDEFVAFTLDVPADFEGRISSRADRLLDRFNRSEERPYELAFSMGHVVGDADGPPPSLDRLLKQADAQLYQQKKKRKRRP
jgi:diguanylate cyclase (GGDEF)-like protein